MGKDLLYPLRRLHGMCHEWCLKQEKKKEIKKLIATFVKKKKQNPKTIYLVFTPEHCNMGDHAIALAETEMLKKAGIDYVEISGRILANMNQFDMLGKMNGSPILVQGGGNLGTLWFGVEKLFREIIKENPGSQIITHPNTIYYEDSEWGNGQFWESVQIYNQHKHLFLYARENTSFDVMNAAYQNVKLIPDVVLSLNECKEDIERNGCMICLRKDCEKTRTDEEEQLMIVQIENLFGKRYHYSDMCLDHNVGVAERKEELDKKFEEFRRAELVVTDRLHGMIFAAITGTPCIVINSKSPKVKGCYQWIKDLEYIRFADRVEDIHTIYNEIPQKAFVYDDSKLAHYYDELMMDLKSILEGKN